MGQTKGMCKTVYIKIKTNIQQWTMQNRLKPEVHSGCPERLTVSVFYGHKPYWNGPSSYYILADKIVVSTKNFLGWWLQPWSNIIMFEQFCVNNFALNKKISVLYTCSWSRWDVYTPYAGWLEYYFQRTGSWSHQVCHILLYEAFFYALGYLIKSKRSSLTRWTYTSILIDFISITNW